MTAPRLVLTFKKKKDAGTVFTCCRADGSVTSTDIGPHHAFGPMHDMAHYVIERWFGFADGFLGMVAGGWTIRDFEKPGVPARLPPDAVFAEAIAGQLSIEMGTRQRFTVAEFNAAVAHGSGSRWPDDQIVRVSQEDLDGIRANLIALLRRWSAIPLGESLRMEFIPGQQHRTVEDADTGAHTVRRSE